MLSTVLFNLRNVHFLFRNEEIKTLKSPVSDATLGFELLFRASELEPGLLMLSEQCNYQPISWVCGQWGADTAHGTAGREALNDGIPEQWLAAGPHCLSQAPIMSAPLSLMPRAGHITLWDPHIIP